MKLNSYPMGRNNPLFLIAGPCVIESREQSLEVATTLKQIEKKLGILVIYKSSFDKANRSSGTSFRGPGLEQGLKILSDIRAEFELPVLTDIHLPEQAQLVGEVVDVLQIPAFLCRQTDLLEAAAKTGKLINLKKGQFASPFEMSSAVKKITDISGENVMLCERGSTFGYHNLVVDMRSLEIMSKTRCPVVFDATHSVQLPGSQGNHSGGEREYIPILARAAVAVGVAGIFMEVHPDPKKALSDGPNSWPLSQLQELLEDLLKLDALVKNQLISTSKG